MVVEYGPTNNVIEPNKVTFKLIHMNDAKNTVNLVRIQIHNTFLSPPSGM